MDSTQRIANEVDQALFNLARRTDGLADDSRIKHEGEKWQEITLLLIKARRLARVMMHPDDLAAAKH